MWIVTEAEGFFVVLCSWRVPGEQGSVLRGLWVRLAHVSNIAAPCGTLLHGLDAGAAAQDRIFIWRLRSYLETSKKKKKKKLSRGLEEEIEAS